MKHVGIDGCPDGWLAIEYAREEFRSAELYDDIESLWGNHGDAESILIDVPIGLREGDNTPRLCDAAARDCLGSPRSSSVFPTPIRGVLGADSYEEAKEIQEDSTDGSLGTQTWGISDKIEELDNFIDSNRSGILKTIRESHPEICYWALNGRQATRYSKTGSPIAAFWERVEILEGVDGEILSDIRKAGTDLDGEATNDDLLDAFVLAVTGSPLTGDLQTLPEKEHTDDAISKGSPMEMVYADL